MKNLVITRAIDSILPGRIVIGGKSNSVWNLPSVKLYTSNQVIELTDMSSMYSLINDEGGSKDPLMKTIELFAERFFGAKIDPYTVKELSSILNKDTRYKCENFDIFGGDLVIEFLAKNSDLLHLGDRIPDYHDVFPFVAVVKGGFTEEEIEELLGKAKSEKMNTYRIYLLAHDTILSKLDKLENPIYFKEILERLYKYLVCNAILKNLE